MRTHLTDLLDYELWANQRVIDALETLDNPPARAIALMGHVLAAQHVWYGRMAHEPTFVSIWEDIPVSWMRETAERQHHQTVSYVGTLSNTELTQPIHYVNTQGTPFTNDRLTILTHMSHHAAYHRGQIVQLIRPQLAEAPVTDFIVWARDGHRQANPSVPSVGS